MSVKLISAGMLDSIQDLGRRGYQHLGINPGGAMDAYSAQLANLMVGNELSDPVIELHFPAGAFSFDAPALIAIAGADFSPSVNGEAVAPHQPLVVGKDAVLSFQRKNSGARAYLAIRNLDAPRWLGSSSTNMTITRPLRRGDLIPVRDDANYEQVLSGSAWSSLSFKTEPATTGNNIVDILPGKEFEMLTEKSRDLLLNGTFLISNSANRMGYELEGGILDLRESLELVSTGVNFGTIQLPPSGKPIILMADHQSTGGYPRVAHVISAHLHTLAQMQPGDPLKFSLTDPNKAEEQLLQQQRHLLQLKNACKLRLAAVFG